MKILDDMSSVLAVRKYGSMSKAATELGANPATISRRIARVGETLGVQPFIKTDAGWQLNPALQDLVDLYEEFEGRMAAEVAQLGSPAATQPRDIKIGAPPSIISQVLVPAMNSLIGGRARLRPTFDRRLFESGLGAHDIVIAYQPPESGRLQMRRCGTMRHGLFASRNWRPENGWVGAVPGLSTPFNDHARAVFGSDPVLMVDSFDQVRNAMIRLDLAGPLPTYAVRDGDGLRLLQQEATLFTMELFVFFHQSRRGDPAVRSAVDWICEAIGRL